MVAAVAALCALAATAALAAAPRGSAQAARGLRPAGAGRRLADAAETVTEVCVDSARWEQLPWVYLSYKERSSWAQIGWSEEAWDRLHPILSPGATTTPAPPNVRPETDTACYQDLDEDQQDAVRLLGYSISTWHLCKNPGCAWPPMIPRPNAPCLDKMLYLEGKYNNSRTWMDIGPQQREALVILGWDVAGQRWAISDKPTSYARRWAELTQKQVEAASFLGYESEVWEGCAVLAPCIQRLAIYEDRAEAYRWPLMPKAIQQRYEELGWTYQTWLLGEVPASYEVPWLELPMGQRTAARLLGFTQDTWDGCKGAPCFDRFSWVESKYGAISWDQMKLAKQQAWSLLGHSMTSWAQGGMANTRTMQMRWEELSFEQQAEATFLGHSEGTWQGCNQDWTGANMGNSSVIDTNNSYRTVRSRMIIQRPFSEVSGNVYGAAVASLPVSFIQVFERSVARALFCGNAPFSSDPSTYVDDDGTPRCKLADNYERQKSRIRVVSVREGSIIVDFVIAANATVDDHSAVFLFDALNRQLSSVESPITQDSEFGIFGRAASMEEIALMNLSPENLEAALIAEQRRNAYGPGRACELYVHSEPGQKTKCPTVSSGSARSSSLAGPLAALLAVALGLLR